MWTSGGKEGPKETFLSNRHLGLCFRERQPHAVLSLRLVQMGLILSRRKHNMEYFLQMMLQYVCLLCYTTECHPKPNLTPSQLGGHMTQTRLLRMFWQQHIGIRSIYEITKKPIASSLLRQRCLRWFGQTSLHAILTPCTKGLYRL